MDIVALYIVLFNLYRSVNLSIRQIDCDRKKEHLLKSTCVAGLPAGCFSHPNGLSFLQLRRVLP